MNKSLKRKYLNTPGVNNDAIYFKGIEVEKTAQYGKPTLFVVGIQNAGEIINMATATDIIDLENIYQNINHIYLGANKSFKPTDKYEPLIDQLLQAGYWVTIDYPVHHHNFIMQLLQNHMRNSRLIPMISVELPNIEIYNYNTILKLDDVDIDHSNPGVWCHSLHDLMDRDKFTDWDNYINDEIVK